MSALDPPLEGLEGAASRSAEAAPQPRERIRLDPRRRGINPRYGAMVSVLKVALPALALVLTAAVVAWPLLKDTASVEQSARVLAEAGDLDAMRMLNPNYAGVDEKQQPFTVTAAEMRKDSPDSPSIALTDPKADVLMSDGSWAFVTASDGVYDQVAQVLELQGDVNFFQDQGYELRTRAATFDLLGGSAYGFDPVEGQGPFGTLSAEGGFQMLNRGEQVMLVGPSKVVIRPEADQ